MTYTNQTDTPQSSQANEGNDGDVKKILTQIAVGTAVLGGIIYLSKTNPQVNGVVKKGVDIASDASSQKVGEFVDRTETIIASGISSVANATKTQANTRINKVTDIIKDILS